MIKIAMACVIMVMSQVVALPVFTPVGLNPVAEYQLVFVIDTTRNATSTGIAYYNAFVQVAADVAWLNGGTILDGVKS